MGQYQFKCWCSDAVSGIIFPPDRQQISEELYRHMEDHYDALIQQGIGKEEALRLTVEAMGDARVIAPQLAAIHRPFWGYFLRATRIMLVLLLIVTIIPLGIFLRKADYREPSAWGFDIFDPGVHAQNGHTLLYHGKPDCSVTSGGYRFTVTDAVVWTYRYTDGNGSNLSRDILCLRMSETNFLPWAEHTGVGQWFRAEDSRGIIYESTNTHDPASGTPCLCAASSRTGPFTDTYLLWINDFELADTQWIKIRYDRDGRDLVWSIDLSGGGMP